MASRLSCRSAEKERIDDPDTLSLAQLRRVFDELRLVNRWLGGSAATLRATQPVLEELHSLEPESLIWIADFGSGSADLPLSILKSAARRSISVRTLALDLNFAACQMAQRGAALQRLDVAQADARRPPLRQEACHIITCSALLHHFGDDELVEILQGLYERASAALIIVDLHRNILAYWGIRLLTLLFSRSEAVRQDGPLSVRRAFRRRELKKLLLRAGLTPATIKWRWAFRYVVTVKKPRRSG